MLGALFRSSRFVSRRSFSAKAQSIWSHVEQGPPDPILGVSEAFQRDQDPSKVSLGVGAYRDDAGKPFVLPSVIEGEKRAISSPTYNHEYLSIGGLQPLLPLTKALAFGEDDKNLDNTVSLQSLSGTGSLRVLAGFIARHWSDPSKLPTVYVPNPTWGNHHQIFNHMGIATKTYRYYKPETCGLDFEGMMTDLKGLDSNSVVLFHATAHNPTGVDPKPAQWDEMCDLIVQKNLPTIFDMAYQGFASGDCDKDAYSLRHFRSRGVPFMLAQSFAKNFGLYGQRCGAVSIVCGDEDEVKRVESQIKIVARALYSNPPSHGARIVYEILKDPALKKQWLADVKGMAERIIAMRVALTEGLAKAGSQKDWSHICDQIGMFCYTGLSGEQVDALTKDHHIYLTRNGRISMAGLNTSNVQRVADAIHQVSK